MRDREIPSSDRGATPQREEEFRALLLRLLRLVAAEVAERLQQRNDSPTRRGDYPEEADG